MSIFFSNVLLFRCYTMRYIYDVKNVILMMDFKITEKQGTDYIKDTSLDKQG